MPRKFVSFSRFAPKLVATKARKVRRFILGLKPTIRCIILALGGVTLEDDIEAAIQQEFLEEDEASQG